MAHALEYRNDLARTIECEQEAFAKARELLMQIKEMAGEMGFEVLHGIVDCLWVIGEPISVFNEAVEVSIIK